MDLDNNRGDSEMLLDVLQVETTGSVGRLNVKRERKDSGFKLQHQMDRIAIC